MSLTSIDLMLLALLSADRAVTDQELITAGIVQLLGAGPRAAVEILDGLLDIWPGAGLSEARLTAALVVAERAGLIVRTAALDGSCPWTLSADGALEIDMTRSWHADLRSRFCEQTRGAAVQAFGTDPGMEQVQHWAALLETAIAAGLRDAAVYEGRVSAVGYGLLPASVNVAAVKAALNADDARPEVREFLYGCAEAALDMTDVFGTEIVTVIVVQFVLHAIVSRRDQAGSAAVLGSLAGQRAVLDTPILLRLLGPSAIAEPAERTIRAAVRAGLHIMVCEHSVEELFDAVLYAREHSLPDDRASMSTAEAAAYGRLVDSDIVALAATAIGEGRYVTWEAFERAADGIRTVLTELGVEFGNRTATTILRLCKPVATR